MFKLMLMLLLRYVGAILLASVMSFMTAILGIFIIASAEPDSFPEYLNELIRFVLFAVVGLIGVFSGTVCLHRSSWRYGSIVLLGLGLGFYTWFWLLQSYSIPPFHYRGLPDF
jgi:hypothetical protein